MDAALTGTYNGLVDNVPAAAVTATAARAAEALANRSGAASKQAAQTAAQTARREMERKGAEKLARAATAAAERTAAANAARPGLGAPPASAAPAGGAAPAAPAGGAGGATTKAGAGAYAKLTKLAVEEAAKLKAGGVVNAAPKFALGGAAMGAGRMVAGAATTAAGNALVDAALPRDSSNSWLQAGRGVGLTASGAAGGYIAGGPVGAIVGAVANPTMDIIKTTGEIQESKANAKQQAAETEKAKLLYGDPDSPENKAKAIESNEKNRKDFLERNKSSASPGTNLTGSASSTGTAFDNAMPNRPAAPMPSTSPVAAAGTAVPMGDDIDPVTGKKRKKEPVDTYAGLA